MEGSLYAISLYFVLIFYQPYIKIFHTKCNQNELIINQDFNILGGDEGAGTHLWTFPILSLFSTNKDVIYTISSKSDNNFKIII